VHCGCRCRAAAERRAWTSIRATNLRDRGVLEARGHASAAGVGPRNPTTRSRRHLAVARRRGPLPPQGCRQLSLGCERGRHADVLPQRFPVKPPSCCDFRIPEARNGMGAAATDGRLCVAQTAAGTASLSTWPGCGTPWTRQACWLIASSSSPECVPRSTAPHGGHMTSNVSGGACVLLMTGSSVRNAAWVRRSLIEPYSTGTIAMTHPSTMNGTVRAIHIICFPLFLHPSGCPARRWRQPPHLYGVTSAFHRCAILWHRSWMDGSSGKATSLLTELQPASDTEDHLEDHRSVGRNVGARSQNRMLLRGPSPLVEQRRAGRRPSPAEISERAVRMVFARRGLPVAVETIQPVAAKLRLSVGDRHQR